MPTLVCPECNARFTADLPGGATFAKCLRCQARVPVLTVAPKPAHPDPLPEPVEPIQFLPDDPAPALARPVEPPVEKPVVARPTRPRPPRVTCSVPPDHAGTQSGNRLLLVGGVVAAVVAALGVAGIAWLVKNRGSQPITSATSKGEKPIQADRPATLSGEQIYPQLLRSTAFILTAENFLGKTYVSVGSGFLVHRDRRLLITNHHVVGNHPVVLAFFPEYDKGHELITDPKQYATNVAAHGIRAKVLTQDPRIDLAVLELERVPDGIQSLPLATSPAPIGSSVYSIGSSGVDPRDLSGSLWRLSTGTVRGRSRQQLKFRSGSTVDAMVLETQKPINPGDSGGPTVNDRCELVSVVMGSRIGEDLVKFDVDVVEVHDILTRYSQSAGWAWNGAKPAAQPTGSSTNPSPSAEDRLKEAIARLKSADPKEKAEGIRELARLHDGARSAIPTILSALNGVGPAEQGVFEQSLRQIGPPERADQAVLVQAIESPNPAARRYALEHYAKTIVAPREALPKLVELLGNESAPIRAEAIQALKRFGPGCRVEAFAALVDRLGDTDAATAATASEMLNRFTNLTSNELETLKAKLTHTHPEVRRYAARMLIDRAQGPRDALTIARILFRDGDVTIRQAVLEALTKWRSEIKDAVPDLLRLCEDTHPTVRIKAVGLVAGYEREPGALDTLIRVAEKDSAAEAREAAYSALAGLELNRPTDLPALRLLLKHKSADFQTRAAERIAQLGEDGAAATDDLIDALSRGSDESREAAIRALSAIGPRASNKAVEPLGRLLTGKDVSQSVTAAAGFKDRLAAAAVLARMGEPGLRSLLAALREKGLPGPVSTEVRRAISSFGDKAEPAVKDLLLLADQPAQRSSVGNVLVAIGGDAVIDGLIKKTELVYVTQNRKKVDVVPADYRLWAIETLGNLDAKRLTDKQFHLVTTRLDFVASRERDSANKTAATRALNRLEEAAR